jgi:hypothetical protein
MYNMANQQPYWVDISGILGIQRALLNVGSDVNDGNFNSLNNAVDTANNSILPTLTYQKEVMGIVNREKDRLQKRKAIIDNAYMGQRRMVELTDSVTAKNQAYNYMLFIIVLIIFAYLGIKILKTMEIVPLIVLEIANILVISVGIIYCVYLYIDIKKRYNMDFNQVVMREPPAKSQNQLNKDLEKNVNSGDLLSIAGKKGCQADHTYNKSYDICVPNAPPKFIGTADSGYTVTHKYFVKDDGTFEWKDAAALTTANGCGGVDKYDFASLACKTNGFRNINVAGSSADAQAFAADEFANYGKY